MSASQDLTAAVAERSAGIDRLAASSGQMSTLLVHLSDLDASDARTSELYKKIHAAAIKYVQEDFDADRYVFSAGLFAETVIMGFEGVENGDYTLENVLSVLNAENKKEKLLAPLERVARGLESVVGEIRKCIEDSDDIARRTCQQAAFRTVMGDVTMEIIQRPDVITTVGTMLGLSSNALGTIMTVSSVFSRTALAWQTAEQQRMQENKQLHEKIRTQLNQVARIVGDQKKLVGKICELVPETITMQQSAERSLASEKPIPFEVKIILTYARQLQDLCSRFTANVERM